MIREAFTLIYSMNLRLPTRFVLLDKAIATLGSLGVELYPEFNVFEVAKPYARGLMLGRFSPGRVLSRARRESYDLAQIALELPYQVHDILQEVRDGQIEVGFVHKGLDEFLHKLDIIFNRLVVAMIVSGGLLGLERDRDLRPRRARRSSGSTSSRRSDSSSPGCSARGCSGVSCAPDESDRGVACATEAREPPALAGTQRLRGHADEEPGRSPPASAHTRPFSVTTPRPWRGVGRSGSRRHSRRSTSYA